MMRMTYGATLSVADTTLSVVPGARLELASLVGTTF